MLHATLQPTSRNVPLIACIDFRRRYGLQDGDGIDMAKRTIQRKNGEAAPVVVELTAEPTQAHPV
mgnify:CR=1 FL=1